MQALLRTLLRCFEDPAMIHTKIIPWSCPVPSFGDYSDAIVATIGLNPSKREFVDPLGIELVGSSRRLQTLTSLGITRWGNAKARHVDSIIESCRAYFCRNPYDRWFRVLDELVSGTGASYYSPSSSLCHLDLIPFATAVRWTELSTKQRTMLLALAGDTLGLILRDSSIRLIVLNGMTVVSSLQQISDATLTRTPMREWTLPRRCGRGVVGYAFRGTMTRIGGVDLQRSICVLGLNHNIQSSFGVTRRVKAAIGRWIENMTTTVIHATS